MVIITDENSIRFSIENTRNGWQFVAWLDEETRRWVITREGDTRAAGDYAAHPVGTIEQDGVSWIGYPGTLPGTTGTVFDTREKALAWVTDDRASDATETNS